MVTISTMLKCLSNYVKLCQIPQSVEAVGIRINRGVLKWGVPPNSAILIGFSIVNHSFWGTHFEVSKASGRPNELEKHQVQPPSPTTPTGFPIWNNPGWVKRWIWVSRLHRLPSHPSLLKFSAESSPKSAWFQPHGFQKTEWLGWFLAASPSSPRSSW